MKFSQHYPPLLEFLRQSQGATVLYPLPPNETPSDIMAQVTNRACKVGARVEQKVMYIIDPKSGESSKALKIMLLESGRCKEKTGPKISK